MKVNNDMEFCSKQTMKKVYDHIRYLSDRRNRINMARQWDLDHPEEAKKRKDSWYIENKQLQSNRAKTRHKLNREEDNLRTRNNYYKNRESRIQQVLLYQKNNPDKVNARNRDWRKKNPDKYLEYQKKSLTKLAKELSMTYTNYRRALQAWSLAVKTRDNFTCQWCGSKTNHEAHHILWKSLFPFDSLEVSNGITLCEPCHDEAEQLQLVV